MIEILTRERAKNECESFSFAQFTAQLDPDMKAATLEQIGKQLADQYAGRRLRDSNQEVIGVKLVDVRFALVFGRKPIPSVT